MILIVLIGVMGLICLYAEFFLPGGILALFSFLLLFLSVFLFFWTASSSWSGFVYFLSLAISSYLVCLLALKMIRKSRGSFCLHQDQEGFVSSQFTQDLTGKEGVVFSELKPSGHVRIDGKVYQAISTGEFLIGGTLIEVVSMRGSHLVVKLKKKEIL